VRNFCGLEALRRGEKERGGCGEGGFIEADAVEEGVGLRARGDGRLGELLCWGWAPSRG
jgi:hypothetical protein